MQEKPRVIVTTDMEVDDMNSMIHLALYLNELDVKGFVYTASQYHFQGDGAHTLSDVNPHWRTKGRRAYESAVVPPEPDPAAGELASYRPFPDGWIERLWANEYAQAYPHLNDNAPGFPTPEELIARTYRGNIAFEGDVREDTQGSDIIKAAILEDDPRPLWLLSWGGMNTIVRALMSIAETWQDTPSWSDVQQHVYRSVRVMGVTNGIGQDNSWLDHGKPLFPDLTFWRVPFMYGGYVDAKTAQQDSIDTFRAPWPQRNLIDDNGALMARYMLYGDGKVYPNEPERFQFGVHARLDWGWEGMEPLEFQPGDFMAEGDSMTYMPLLPFGLRGADNPDFSTILGTMFKDGQDDDQEPAARFGEPASGNPNPYLRAYQEDFAARAQWCAHGYEACNHPPVISNVTSDAIVHPKQTVALNATVNDPDGDAVRCSWRVDMLATRYKGKGALDTWSAPALQTTFTIPDDARTGDHFVVTLTARDVARRPMTRYAHVTFDIM